MSDEDILKEQIKGLPLSPIIRIMRDEMQTIKGEILQITKEAKYFMRELVEEFIRQTIRETLLGGFIKTTKTITADDIHRALRLPPDISNLRTDSLRKCLKRAKAKIEEKLDGEKDIL